MTRHKIRIVTLIVAILSCGALVFGAGANRQPHVTVLVQKSINPPQRTEISVLRIQLAPGASAAPHIHPEPTFGYVLDGELQFQVEGGLLTVYHAGQTFYEPPNAVHLGSRNPSNTAPVTFLAFFVGQQGKPVKIPALGMPGRAR